MNTSTAQAACHPGVNDFEIGLAVPTYRHFDDIDTDQGASVRMRRVSV